MILDAKKAPLHAAMARELHVQLPAKAGGGFARLHRALYGTRDVPAVWEAYAASQLQSISARRVFPGFDEPRFKTPFDVTITARSTDTVITTNPEVSAEDLGDGMTRHTFATTDPLPTYLLAFAVGPYDVNEWEDLQPNRTSAALLT